MALVLSAFFVSRGVLAAPESETAAAGEVSALDVPGGEIEIASGNSAGADWLLSAPAGERCVSLTTDSYAADTCAGPRRSLNMYEIPLGSDVLVFGDVRSDVTNVELNVHYAKVAEGWTVELLDPPSNLQSERRYFVSSVPFDALLATVVAASPEGSVAERVPSIGPGTADGRLEAQEFQVCSSSRTAAEEELEAEARVLMEKISQAKDRVKASASRSKVGVKQIESLDGSVKSCDKVFAPPSFSPGSTSSGPGSESRKG